MAEGKFFYFKSKENGQVLRIDDAVEGSRVFLADKKRDTNELWYEDKINNVIRCRKDDNLCLTVPGDRVTVKQFHTANEDQLWKISGDRIVHTDESRQGERGMLTIMSDGDEHKHWDIVFVTAPDFFIETFMESSKHPGEHLVLDISGKGGDPGSKVILNNKDLECPPSQLWYEDRFGYIHSKLNDFVLDVKKELICINPYADNVVTQQWVKAGKAIVNRHKPIECFDVRGEKNKKGATMCPYDYKGSDNQHWNFRYIN